MVVNPQMIGTSVIPAPSGMKVYQPNEITGNHNRTPSPAPIPAKRVDMIQVSEKETIHLIEKLDNDSKKTLNALVQSVLLTQ